MTIVLGLRGATDDDLRFAAQIGAGGVMVPPPDQGDKGYYDFASLANLRSQVESYGLKLESVAMLPWQWTYKWMLGLPGRDEQIENFQKTIRNLGAAGIPVFIYNMHVLRQYRTSRHAPGRGGALATSFDAERVRNAPLMAGGPGTDTDLIPLEYRRPVTDDELWDNLTYFVKAVVPVAEEAGVKLALHPDDPPVPSIGGVARIMRSPAAYRRAIEIVPSDYNGVCFCQGCFAEMGADVFEEIRYFGSRKKIFFVHFRNIRGKLENFSEAFPDDGQMDMLRAMQAYAEVGFDGPMSPDHALHLVGDTDWGHRYWAYAVGYMKGLQQAVGAKP
ncbi:MAG: mannonate dehydratase [Bacteroidetes bacterium]|nr:mannonate dehydratase [Bacteroidota bacterium]